jgi:type VI protein secretion system component VasF
MTFLYVLELTNLVLILGFDGSGFRITSRYKMVNGSAEELNVLLAIAPNVNGIVL